jgi:hypothetical protein
LECDIPHRFHFRVRIWLGKLAEKYRQRRKTVNENLGLIIALAASCAALWTGYEARHARLEARAAAEQSLKVQQDSVNAQTKSVDAQIASMRLEQRPYMKVTPVGVVPKWFAGSPPEVPAQDGYLATFNLLTVGRTPAISVEWKIDQGFRRRGQFNVDLGEADDAYSSLVWIDRFPVANSGDTFVAKLPFTKRVFYLTVSDRNRTPGNARILTFIVDVNYTDLFSDKHHTQECFYVVADPNLPLQLVPCNHEDFKSVIE